MTGMGVQGLTSLVDAHRRIYRDVQFRESRLVIDGCNLLYKLYFDFGLDQNHGGEYATFEVLIEKFVKALRECRISPYVVLDGGSDYTDKKLQTLTLRAKNRIKKAHQAAEGNQREGVLPQLVKLVFKQTLDRLEVPLAQCYGEADREIAALAREWRCPVLSQDSDFYIFDLPAGLLPLSDFRWDALKHSGSRSYIPCKNYTTSSFCIFFSVQQQLLPTFAALAGNDYVKLRIGSFSWAQFAPEGSGATSRLEGLLCWLRGFCRPQEAFEAALGLMGDLSSERKAELLKDLCLGMEEYQLPPCSLKKFFIHGSAPPFPAEVAGLVPDWTWLPLTQARLNPELLDLLLLQRMSLTFPVGHAHLPSAHLVSRPLRQVMYGLLLGGGRQVMERDRDGIQLTFIPVQPTFTGASRQLLLPYLDQAEPSQRLQVLLEALQVTEDSLSCLPPQLRLPVAVTCYWLQRAQPPPEKELLDALLLGLSTGPPPRPTEAPQPRRQLDVGVAHTFNQWQSCLMVSIQLNQLLGFPLPEPQISRLYEGTLVHQLVHQMRSEGKLRPFGKNSLSVKLYQSFQAVVQQFHTQKATASSETQKTAQQPRPVDDLTPSLQRLFLLNKDEEAATEASCSVRVQEDLGLGNLMSVRTRYRTKERNNRCRNPELARKEECRGWDLL
ncbi:protein asteroid homolog 1-like [Cyclopterus lumpus]|uniref:protein asteroid homolog 1-like n=1 Tax=Cyclopterus lumpus TaxID=8103 RepID=UPI0014874BEA|nr:protein asteroid homolog 1-like [Cyclopterus lumpus]